MKEKMFKKVMSKIATSHFQYEKNPFESWSIFLKISMNLPERQTDFLQKNFLTLNLACPFLRVLKSILFFQ